MAAVLVQLSTGGLLAITAHAVFIGLAHALFGNICRDKEADPIIERVPHNYTEMFVTAALMITILISVQPNEASIDACALKSVLLVTVIGVGFASLMCRCIGIFLNHWLKQGMFWYHRAGLFFVWLTMVLGYFGAIVDQVRRNPEYDFCTNPIYGIDLMALMACQMVLVIICCALSLHVWRLQGSAIFLVESFFFLFIVMFALIAAIVLDPVVEEGLKQPLIATRAGYIVFTMMLSQTGAILVTPYWVRFYNRVKSCFVFLLGRTEAVRLPADSDEEDDEDEILYDPMEERSATKTEELVATDLPNLKVRRDIYEALRIGVNVFRKLCYQTYTIPATVVPVNEETINSSADIELLPVNNGVVIEALSKHKFVNKENIAVAAFMIVHLPLILKHSDDPWTWIAMLRTAALIRTPSQLVTCKADLLESLAQLDYLQPVGQDFVARALHETNTEKRRVILRSLITQIIVHFELTCTADLRTI